MEDRLFARDDVESASASRQWESICRAAVRGLPENQRRALELAYFEGLTHLQIAEATAAPLGTVKTRVRLGLLKLREKLPLEPSRAASAGTAREQGSRASRSA